MPQTSAPPVTLEDELEVFKACADATRLRILALLSEGELCVCDIVAVLQMPQAKVSRHLAVLRAASLVQDRRVGTWIHYSLTGDSESSPLWRRLRSWLRAEAGRAAAADLERLQDLCACGDVCPPRSARSSRPGPRRRTGATVSA